MVAAAMRLRPDHRQIFQQDNDKYQDSKCSGTQNQHVPVAAVFRFEPRGPEINQF